jgi:hypothetical protein
MAETDVIRTPDQRVRVFVSSTLRELAAERQAVQDAVTRLRLVPVMFELGARPHPPRPVYQAWLLLFEEAPADRANPQQASAAEQVSLAHHSGGTHGNPSPEIGHGSRAPE